jgi:hypothetical protein
MKLVIKLPSKKCYKTAKHETKGKEPDRTAQLKFVLMINSRLYSGRSTEIKLLSK